MIQTKLNKMERFLIYFGAGWDIHIFFEEKLKSYENYLMIDALPNNKHFRKGTLGYEFCYNKEILFTTLNQSFEQHDIYSDCDIERYPWSWNAGKYKYYYNTSCEDFKFNGKCDIVMKGFQPSNYKDFNASNIYLDQNNSVFTRELYKDKRSKLIDITDYDLEEN